MNAPDVKDRDVVLWNNSVTRLSRFWEKGPLVLVFLQVKATAALTAIS